VVVVEVLSPNTQRYDRGDKRLAYQSLKSLQEYVLVAQDAPKIEVFSRTEAGWEYCVYDALEDALHLPSIGFSSRLAAIYA
jgi:Uma2 family endonuclease